jgi:thioredoxin 1
LRAAAEELVPGLVWRELNVLDELDYASELGVLTLTAIAIDGRVVFSALPTSCPLSGARHQFPPELP